MSSTGPGPTVPEFVDPPRHWSELSLDGLRAYRRRLSDEEERVSYWRRLVHARIDVLTEHHDERLDLTLQACRQRPTSAADLLSVLFRRELDLHQTTFAIGEAVAHLHRLWAQGALRRERDTAGVWRFRAI